MASIAGARVILGIGALLTLSACATPARPELMVPQSLAMASPRPGSPLTGGIAVARVGGGEETNPLMVAKVGDRELQEAVRGALGRYGFLSSEADPPFRLDVFLVEFKQPASGFTMIVDALIRYKLTRSRDGAVVYDDIVTASHKVTVDEAFAGPVRLKLATEGAVRANLAAFLERLSALELMAPR